MGSKRVWHDWATELNWTRLPEDKEQVCQTTEAHANEIHQTDDTKLVGSAANSRDNPNCDYQAGCPERTACNHMVTCLIAGLQETGHKAVNFDKLREITQWPDENAAQILARLTEGIVLLT